MEPSSYRPRGWFYTIVGVGLFVGAIAALFDPNATKIYLGAFVVGPYLFIRGINLLLQAQQLGPLSDYDKGVPDATHPAGLNILAVRDASVRLEATCESCGTSYLYFPQMTPKSKNDMLATGECVAPCPRCGWIGAPMLDVARNHAPGVTFIFTLGVAIICLASLVAMVGQTPREGTPPTFWVAIGLIVLTGVVFLVWATRRQRKWDPNSQSPAKRLAIAAKLCMPRETYELLIDTSPVPDEPAPQLTGIKQSGSQDIQ